MQYPYFTILIANNTLDEIMTKGITVAWCMKKIGEKMTVEPGKPVGCANPQVPGFVFGNYPYIAVAEPVGRIENLLFEFRNVNVLTDGIEAD
jgi:hypothetical protein